MLKAELAQPWYIQQSVDQYNEAIQMAEANPGSVPGQDMAYMKMRLINYEKIIKAVEEGSPFALQTLSVPPEIFAALDIPVLHMADYSISALERHNFDSIIEAYEMVENIWYPATGCAFFKIPIGAVIAGQIPTPTVVVGGSHPCQQGIAGWEVLGELLGAPIYHFESPTWNDERTLDYLAEEVKRLITFLEEHTGKKLDIDRLRSVAEESNKSNEIILEINELRRAVPCPLQGKFLGQTFRAKHWLGLPETTVYLEELLADATGRVKRGEKAVPEERLRVLWYDIGIPFLPLYNWFEREWGAVVVMDLLTYTPYVHIDTSSYESMLRGLAYCFLNVETMNRVNHGLAPVFIDEFVRVYEDYGCTCAAFAGHYADKARPIMLSILKEVCRERKIPLLNLPYDSFDPRVVSAEHILDKISQFLTTVVLP